MIAQVNTPKTGRWGAQESGAFTHHSLDLNTPSPSENESAPGINGEDEAFENGLRLLAKLIATAIRRAQRAETADKNPPCDAEAA